MSFQVLEAVHMVWTVTLSFLKSNTGHLSFFTLCHFSIDSASFSDIKGSMPS